MSQVKITLQHAFTHMRYEKTCQYNINGEMVMCIGSKWKVICTNGHVYSNIIIIYICFICICTLYIYIST